MIVIARPNNHRSGCASRVRGHLRLHRRLIDRHLSTLRAAIDAAADPAVYNRGVTRGSRHHCFQIRESDAEYLELLTVCAIDRDRGGVARVEAGHGEVWLLSQVVVQIHQRIRGSLAARQDLRGTWACR
jgi:hypothetical protein